MVPLKPTAPPRLPGGRNDQQLAPRQPALHVGQHAEYRLGGAATGRSPLYPVRPSGVSPTGAWLHYALAARATQRGPKSPTLYLPHAPRWRNHFLMLPCNALRLHTVCTHCLHCRPAQADHRLHSGQPRLITGYSRLLGRTLLCPARARSPYGHTPRRPNGSALRKLQAITAQPIVCSPGAR